jgi:AraC-like DNA-binding protein
MEEKDSRMTMKTNSESTQNTSRDHSAKVESNGWFLHQFRVAFKELTEPDPPGGGSDHANDTCHMVMCLNGEMRVCLTGPDQKNDFFISAGSCSLQYHPRHCHCLNCAHQPQVQVLELVCPAAELVRLVSNTPVGHELEAAVKAGRPLHIHQPMSPALHQALFTLREGLTDPDRGAAPLVLAKALEMVWLFARSRSQGTRRPISAGTRRAVEKARSLLENNMTDPPGLETLAAAVGMSLSKLKQVFPLVCGLPPYAYLRQVRMEQARRLLDHRGLSVTEAALEVGYSNLSHFAKTFAAHYGINPSQVHCEN